jgi:hypothetical protein
VVVTLETCLWTHHVRIHLTGRLPFEGHGGDDWIREGVGGERHALVVRRAIPTHHRGWWAGLKPSVITVAETFSKGIVVYLQLSNLK